MSQDDDFSLSPLHTFFAKVAIVTAAFLIVVYFVSSLTVSFANAQMDRLTMEVNKLGLKGGSAFWGTVESKLYALADAPDLPPERKQKIIDAIQKLSVKYKPYVDAFAQDGAPSPGPVPAQVRQ